MHRSHILRFRACREAEHDGTQLKRPRAIGWLHARHKTLQLLNDSTAGLLASRKKGSKLGWRRLSAVEYLKICLIRLSPEPSRVLIEFLLRTGLELVGQTRAYLDDFADPVRSGNRKNDEEAKINRPILLAPFEINEALYNQADWPVIFAITGPICARALKSQHTLELAPRGHQDWPVMAMLKKYPNYHVKQFLTAFSIPAYFPSA